jgi:hypothetical protein
MTATQKLIALEKLQAQASALLKRASALRDYDLTEKVRMVCLKIYAAKQNLNHG